MIYNHCAASEYVPLIFQKDLGEEKLNKSNGDERYGIKWSCSEHAALTSWLMHWCNESIKTFFISTLRLRIFFWAIPGSIVHGILPDSM